MAAAALTAWRTSTEILRLMRGPAFLVHRGDHRRGVFRGRLGQDAMAEVEHMAGPAAIAVQHPDHLLSYTLRAGEQDAGVEIALQRDPVPDSRPRVGQLD